MLCKDVFRTATAFRDSPVDILTGILDIASFAMDAIAGVDLESLLARIGLVFNILVDSG
jgi:hypothetical protein